MPAVAAPVPVDASVEAIASACVTVPNSRAMCAAVSNVPASVTAAAWSCAGRPSFTVGVAGSSVTVTSSPSSSRTSTSADDAVPKAYPDPASTVTVTVPCASSTVSSVIGV